MPLDSLNLYGIIWYNNDMKSKLDQFALHISSPVDDAQHILYDD